ncbi:MAG TPA: ATP-binding protein [Isosphaeraceae bacterium]|nr:ATP-binding protein [Isosphaeraceae bacterium]
MTASATRAPHLTTGPTTGDARPGTTVVLVVDDSAVDRRWVGSLVERRAGLSAIYARSGAEALCLLETESPAIVLTDLLMPELDGLALVQQMRALHPLIPVVLMTAHGSERVALQALQQGAASYVPKRELSECLAATIDQVLASAQAGRHQQRLRDCATAVDLRFALDNDPALAAAFVARFREEAGRFDLFDENVLIRVDVALTEALLNGIYHGNLEVSSALRQEGDAAYRAAIDRRRGTAPFRDRRLHVRATIHRDEAVVTIRDEGPGFDPRTLPDPTDPANFERVGGRGLLLIRTFMDEVKFNANGNELTLVKRRTARPRST